MQTRKFRVFKPVLIWAVISMTLVFLSGWINQHSEPHSRLRTIFALLPLIPAFFYLLALVRAVLSLDELQVRIQLEAIAIAFLITIFLTFVFGALQRAQVYEGKWDDIGNSMLYLWAFGYLVSVWRYR